MQNLLNNMHVPSCCHCDDGPLYLLLMIFMVGAHVAFHCAGRSVDLSSVQRVPEPTRDVLVTRDEGGEREFSGFGAAKNDEYADCFIDADKMPEPTIKASVICSTCHARCQLASF